MRAEEGLVVQESESASDTCDQSCQAEPNADIRRTRGRVLIPVGAAGGSSRR